MCEECGLPETICSLIATACIEHERLGASKKEVKEWNREYRNAIQKMLVEAQIEELKRFAKEDNPKSKYYQEYIPLDSYERHESLNIEQYSNDRIKELEDSVKE